MLMYIELKDGCSDERPAMIARVRLSRNGLTVHFNNKVFQKTHAHGSDPDYYDIETHEEYVITSLTKNERDRHWAMHGKIQLQESAVEEYLQFRGGRALGLDQYEIVDIPEED
jgi:hypothetical protein